MPKPHQPTKNLAQQIVELERKQRLVETIMLATLYGLIITGVFVASHTAIYGN